MYIHISIKKSNKKSTNKWSTYNNCFFVLLIKLQSFATTIALSELLNISGFMTKSVSSELEFIRPNIFMCVLFIYYVCIMAVLCIYHIYIMNLYILRSL
jgi:hypothetical protein